MPLVNYCKKCKTERPNGETCPVCGAKLTKSGVRLSFWLDRAPVKDWFSWNAVLRVAVSVMALVLLASVAAEAYTEGTPGVVNLFLQGYFEMLLTVLGVVLLVSLLLFLLQGSETVRYALDQKGAHTYVYIRKPTKLRLYARFTTQEAVEAIRKDGPSSEEGLTLVRKTDLSWQQIKRAQFWPETATCLLYRPFWWQAMCVRCSVKEYAEMEAFVRTKLTNNKRNRKRKR
ncbi:MAG: hypothetical protein PHY64_04805 [Eubacteriales bacterium]|nr:hypothetical protein [Eubacteriales bacterium]